MTMTRSLLRGGAVLAVALAAGHLVQTVSATRTERAAAEAGRAAAKQTEPKQIEPVSAGPDTAAARLAAAPALPGDPVATPTPAPTLAPAAAPEAPASAPALRVAPADKGAAPPAVTELAALTETPPALPALPVLPPLPMLAPPAEIAPPVAGNPAPALADCTPALDLTAAPRAMIAVTLTAPCAAGDRVVLRHAGLTVAERLDAQGRLVLDLPAFDPAGEVSVLFADATQLHSAVAVPDAAQVHRFAVQWMAEDSFQIRAVESGEAYGDASNVWAESPVSAHGGYLMALGDPGLDLPMMAQVYTWPADPAISADPVVEAAVTDLTCGRELLGETIETAPAGPVVRDLTLAMPGCDALGDILVLNNLAGDVTLTAGN